jgi:hypothetical protein
LADDLRQRGLADAWPALAEQIETLEPLLEIGPQDIQLSPPPASGSDAQRCIDLAAVAGLNLYEWQQPDYQQQLARYRDACLELFDGTPVSTALVTVDGQLWVAGGDGRHGLVSVA